MMILLRLSAIAKQKDLPESYYDLDHKCLPTLTMAFENKMSAKCDEYWPETDEALTSDFSAFLKKVRFFDLRNYLPDFNKSDFEKYKELVKEFNVFSTN